MAARPLLCLAALAEPVVSFNTGGLYHVEVRGPDASGRAIEPRQFSCGIVPQREP